MSGSPSNPNNQDVPSGWGSTPPPAPPAPPPLPPRNTPAGGGAANDEPEFPSIWNPSSQPATPPPLPPRDQWSSPARPAAGAPGEPILLVEPGGAAPGPDMEACQITGKWIPKDELVMFRGFRVGAEGKAILLQRLQMGGTLPGELEKPTVLRRFGCMFLDNMILQLIAYVIPLAVMGISFSTQGMDGLDGNAIPRAVFMRLGLTQLVIWTITIVYFTLLHGLKGQSIGKMTGKLHVVTMDGKPISLLRALGRALAYRFTELVPIALMFGGASFELPIMVTVNSLVFVYFIVNVLFALIDKKSQRALHDRIAGTRVIVKL